MTTKNKHAVALGKLSKGIKKKMSQAALDQRRRAAIKPDGVPVTRQTLWRRKKQQSLKDSK